MKGSSFLLSLSLVFSGLLYPFNLICLHICISARLDSTTDCRIQNIIHTWAESVVYVLCVCKQYIIHNTYITYRRIEFIISLSCFTSLPCLVILIRLMMTGLLISGSQSQEKLGKSYICICITNTEVETITIDSQGAKWRDTRLYLFREELPRLLIYYSSFFKWIELFIMGRERERESRGVLFN